MRIRFPLLALLVVTLMVAGSSLWAGERKESPIETIAGGEANDIAGPEFSFGSIAGLATDSLGNTYFTIQALNRVYRLGTWGGC
ncbi:MAG TPA: hypothetical protein VFE61_11905 [Candidatus Sulfotelmatobacter sp.]|jgi:hypothetical protein|nr:hypothetical protein [Candidatus Sulfotelmatobacter sp.]